MARRVRIAAVILSIILILPIIVSAATVSLDGQSSVKTEQIYPGVTATEYSLSKGYTYSSNGKQWLRVIEFDPKDENLAFDVVFAGDNLGAKDTVSNIVTNFNKDNSNKKAIVAVNGDLWTTQEHHARVLGENDNPVVKKYISLPTSMNIVDGEIICSKMMSSELPAGTIDEYRSFGIAADGTPLLGSVAVRLTLKDETTSSSNVNANGLNRLPADDSIVVYTDKGPLSNYCLDDAYEVVIDCDYDYKVEHGAIIRGTVTAICPQNSTRQSMKQNRIIVTARGSLAISKISSFNIGDEISLTVKLSDLYKNTEKWATVSDAVGGHAIVIRNGVIQNDIQSRVDPMTLIGFKENGNVVIIVNDGRQSWYSAGIDRSLYGQLADELGVVSMFLLDGGGSTTLVEMSGSGYKLKNRPSDYATIITSGIERSVINAVIVSAVTKVETPEIPSYSVTWKNENNVIYTQYSQEGEIEFDSTNYSLPTKADSGIYAYSFLGWSKDANAIVPDDNLYISDETIFYAVFTQNLNYEIGDINLDGRVNSLDCNYLIKYVCGLLPYNESYVILGDCNNDGAINAMDINSLKKKFVGY